MTRFRARLLLIILLMSLYTIAVEMPSPVYADSIIGTGTPASCTSVAIQTAINAGGTITFNCGGAVTIPVTATLNVDSMTGAKNVIIDGNGQVTLDGQNARRIFYQRTWGSAANSLTLQNISLINGHISGVDTAANGAAIQSINQSASNQQAAVPVLTIINVTFNNNDATLTSVSSGSEGDYGGAVFSGAGIINVQNSTFTNNDANNAAGGAIHILRSDLTITNSTFTNNSAIGNGQGGAIYVDGYWTAAHNLSIVSSVFDGNTTYQGGGAIYINMYDNTNHFTIDHTTFRNNAVTGGNRAQGGAISGGSTTISTRPSTTGNAVATITNSTFSGNSVQQSNAPFDGSGGAISFNQRAVITIANSTFSGNTAHGTSYGSNGGAIAIGGNTTPFQIINSTIASNHSGWVGGGLAAGNLKGTLANTIIAYNTADYLAGFDQQCSNEFMDNGHNLQYPPRSPNVNYYNETSCFQGKSLVSQRSLPDFRDPLLDVLANNGGTTQTLALLTGSPAIDYGQAGACAASPVSSLDQRGQTRPTDGDGANGPQCDTGAFEYVSTSPPTAPALLTPLNNASLTTNTVTFTWGYGGFATSYRLQVDDDVNFGSPNVDVSNITATSYTVPYLGVGSYHWRVISVNGFGITPSGSQVLNIISPANAVPSLNYFTGLPLTLTWNRVSGATAYQVAIANNQNFTGATVYNLSADTLSLSVSLPDGVYYWHVVARREDGVTWGSWSATESFVVDS